MNGIKIIRRTAVVMILAIVMSLVFAVSASAATWSNVKIGQGKYQGFSTSDSDWFSISKGTSVKESRGFWHNRG